VNHGSRSLRSPDASYDLGPGGVSIFK
jgi:hypothetical protein